MFTPPLAPWAPGSAGVTAQLCSLGGDTGQASEVCVVGCRGLPAATPEPRGAKLIGGCSTPLTAHFSLCLQLQQLDNSQGVSTLLHVPVCVCARTCPHLSWCRILASVPHPFSRHIYVGFPRTPGCTEEEQHACICGKSGNAEAQLSAQQLQPSTAGDSTRAVEPWKSRRVQMP